MKFFTIHGDLFSHVTVKKSHEHATFFLKQDDSLRSIGKAPIEACQAESCSRGRSSPVNFNLFHQAPIEGDIIAAVVHCVSEDVALRDGFSGKLVEAVGAGVRDKLRSEKPVIGETYLDYGAYHMVTKKRAWEMPTKKDFLAALASLRRSVVGGPYLWIVMPKIGSGHDSLPWDWVLSNVKKAFEDWEGHLIVCE
jgi:hypothetical protein